METERDTNLAMIAAMLVLFSAMLDARLTMVISLILVAGLLISRANENRKQRSS